MTDIAFIFDFISKFGFSVFVAVFFMIRTEKAINNNTKALSELVLMMKYKKK